MLNLDDVTVRPDFRDVSDLKTFIDYAIQYVRYENEISYEVYVDLMNKLNENRRFYAHYLHLVHSFVYDLNSLERSRYGIEFED